MNANTPVIIGVAQIQQRISDPLAGKEPIDLMVDAVQAAAVDAGNPGLLGSVDSVRVIRGAWRYKHPAGYVAEKVGCQGAETVGTCFGGNMVQSTLNLSAADILAGKRDLIVLTGAEVGYSQAKAAKAGIELPVTETAGDYDFKLGKDEPMACEAELAREIRQPIQMYPIFENAIRHANGESIEAHRERVSTLWAGFSQVASGNPDAWIKDGGCRDHPHARPG